MNSFAEMFRVVAVPRLVEQFGERGPDGGFKPVLIKLPKIPQPLPWPQVIVGDLTGRLVEENGSIVQREAVNLHGPTDQLPNIPTPFPESVQITVPKYGEVAFHVFPDECKYGGPMTTISLIRVPLAVMDNFNKRRSG